MMWLFFSFSSFSSSSFSLLLSWSCLLLPPAGFFWLLFKLLALCLSTSRRGFTTSINPMNFLKKKPKPAAAPPPRELTPEEREEGRSYLPTETWDELKVKSVVKPVSPLDFNSPKPAGHIRCVCGF